MYWSGPLVVCFGMAGMSYSTYRGFTDVLPLLAPHRSWAWWGWGGACAVLYANCVWNYLAAALVDPGAHTSRAFAELVQQVKTPPFPPFFRSSAPLFESLCRFCLRLSRHL